jgi:hypothetical protein
MHGSHDYAPERMEVKQVVAQIETLTGISKGTAQRAFARLPKNPCLTVLASA